MKDTYSKFALDFLLIFGVYVLTTASYGDLELMGQYNNGDTLNQVGVEDRIENVIKRSMQKRAAVVEPTMVNEPPTSEWIFIGLFSRSISVLS